MPGKEFEDFLKGESFSYKERKSAQSKRIKAKKAIRYDWFRGHKCDFELIVREDWGAREPLHIDEYFELQADVLVNFTDTEECNNVHECIKAVQDLQKAHMDAGEPDIKQNFLVGNDGHIYEGRGFHTKPPFDPKWPDISNCMITIAYIGKRGMFPKKGMVRRAMEFIDVSRQDPNCLQPNVGVYLDYFDPDTPMTDELYNYLHTKEGNELEEHELPKHYQWCDTPPWDPKDPARKRV
uniref:Peptidoglycan recognition protein 13 n=1 Tax=Nephotettix cincticeps TaxID=94400 RepID=A0A5H2WY92_NEPCI|nr:peptidoglycan recognition protein 13 [Nephotettix cincticeps]